jgi:hypothetical protein
MPVENSVITPEVVIRPMRLAAASVNQRLPSGPAVIEEGLLEGVGMGNSRIAGLPDNKQRVSRLSTPSCCRNREGRRGARWSSLRGLELPDLA